MDSPDTFTDQMMKVNPVLVDRVRLAIMAKLVAGAAQLSFAELINSLELTKGNLSTHMRRLEEAGLVIVRKEFVGRKPHTSYQCSEAGKAELTNYLSTLEQVLKNSLG